jgi:hypothetical protein
MVVETVVMAPSSVGAQVYLHAELHLGHALALLELPRWVPGLHAAVTEACNGQSPTFDAVLDYLAAFDLRLDYDLFDPRVDTDSGSEYEEHTEHTEHTEPGVVINTVQEHTVIGIGPGPGESREDAPSDDTGGCHDDVKDTTEDTAEDENEIDDDHKDTTEDAGIDVTERLKKDMEEEPTAGYSLTTIKFLLGEWLRRRS